VVVQQLCSYLKQTTYSELSPEHAYGLFATPTGEPLIAKNQYDKIVEHLIEQDFLKPAIHGGSQLQAGEQWEKLYEERTLYSNLTGTSESPAVFDDLTGKLVGFLDAKMSIGSKFLIGGHAREVISFKGKKVITRAVSSRENIRKAPQKWFWKVKSAALSKSLAQEFGFPTAQENEPFPLVKIQTEEDSGTRNLIFHCAGEVYGKMLAELLENERKIEVIDQNEFFIEISADLENIDWNFSESEINRVISKNWKKFESAFDLGRFQDNLPSDVRRESVIKAVNLDRFRSLLEGVLNR
jgi:hypothetical protein